MEENKTVNIKIRTPKLHKAEQQRGDQAKQPIQDEHLGGVQAEQAEQDDQPSQDQEMKLVSRADLHDDQTEQPCTSPIPKVALPYTSK